MTTYTCTDHPTASTITVERDHSSAVFCGECHKRISPYLTAV
jgi:hypothetical protein